MLGGGGGLCQNILWTWKYHQNCKLHAADMYNMFYADMQEKSMVWRNHILAKII